jgi:arylsulfatase A-like enzyme
MQSPIDPTSRTPMRTTLASALFLLFAGASFAAPPADKPNLVLIVADDLGYGDLSCYGSQTIRTPHLDRLAAEGTRLSSFYVSQAVCTASRASLLSGCYANRVGMAGALNHTSRTGIHESELLLSQLCKRAGYATGCYGKWHLGTLPEFGAANRGFDTFFGLPYSNDNSKYHPIVRDMPPLPLLEGTKTIETDPDQSLFTRRFTDRAVQFIADHKEEPFFLYVPHVMPHVPIFASDKFRGRSPHGLYADVVEELDAGIGEIVAALDEHGLTERTLVIFISDNGPFLSYGHHAGSAGPLREGKLTTFEGGVRVPGIVRWPGHVPAGRTTDELVTSLDLLPTIAALLGAKLPEHKIDGVDVGPFLCGNTEKSPREEFWYYAGDELQAVRRGPWKLHLPHEYLSPADPPGKDGKPANFENLRPESIQQSGLRGIASRHGYVVREMPQTLYNLETDPGETKDVARDHPEVVKELLELAEAARADLGDSLTSRTGPGKRPVGKL